MPDQPKLTVLEGHTNCDWTLDGPCGYANADDGAMIYDRAGNGYLVAQIPFRYSPEDGPANALLLVNAPTLLAIANELADRLTMAGQPAVAAEAFLSRGIKPPAFTWREVTGRDEVAPPQAETDGEG